MSLRSLLMPVVSAHWLSRERLLKARAKAERARQRRGGQHLLHYFHQVDDPYSALLAGALPALQARYDVQIEPHVVGPPPDAAAPDRERLVAYSRRDAALLARRHGLPFTDPGHQPDTHMVSDVSAALVAAVQDGLFVQLAGPLSQALWLCAAQQGRKPDAVRQADAASVQQHLAHSNALRQRLGHYLGATLHYAGEWTWGLDRLHHLETRLQALGAQRPGVTGLMFPPAADLAAPLQPPALQPIDFFFSFRSPYSAIVTPRVFELGRLTGAPVRLRYVLPMVMRGLAVPREKRLYISTDAAREAHLRGVPFGRLNDPVGKPVERGLSLMPLAERQGVGPAYVQSFMQGVWAEGVDAGSDRGLRRIAERAGLRWADAQDALADNGWRKTAEANRQELLSLGLWGVPSFRVGRTAVWGQDRLWAVEEALRGGATDPQGPT